MGKIICNICKYQPETDTLIGIMLDDTIALHGTKITCNICIYLPETDTFIGMMFPSVYYKEFPCVQGNTLTIALGLLIN